MDKLVTADGTTLAVDVRGRGRALVLVGGAFHDRQVAPDLTAALASRFTVVRYDRRGRGSSTGDPGEPGIARRETADLLEVLAAVGDVAAVVGFTTGGVPALRAAASGAAPASGAGAGSAGTARSAGAPRPAGSAAGSDVAVVLVEPPFRTARGPLPARLAGPTLEHLLRARRVDSAVAYYLAAALCLPPREVQLLRAAPVWPLLVEAAPALPADAALLGDHRVPAGLLRRLRVPVVAVTSSGSPRWCAEAAAATAAAAPAGRHVVLAGPPREVPAAPLSQVIEAAVRGR